MPYYRCMTCGKTFDPEKNEICPACGAAVAPSVLTRVERKQTAARLRAEGMYDYDEHCHEDDAWKDSYGAQAHRAAVQNHEANLRAGYRAHSAYDVTNRGANAAPPQGASAANPRGMAQGNGSPQYRTAAGTQTNRGQTRQTSNASALKFLLPLGIVFAIMLLKLLFSAIGSVSSGLYYP